MKNHIDKDIVFSETLPGRQEFWELFQTTDWNDNYHFDEYELEEALKNSWYVVSVYHFDKLIGFGRIIADGIYHALIVDLIIHPDYQKRGLGKELLAKLVTRCTENNIRDIQLFSAKGKSAFYENSGFTKRPLDAPGMQYKYD
jgi:GNAT superfamily N-acetyltransferase